MDRRAILVAAALGAAVLAGCGKKNGAVAEKETAKSSPAAATTATPKVATAATTSPAPPRVATPTPPPVYDASRLITRDEIQQVQGSAVTDVKVSETANTGLRTAQSFYTATEFSKSISLAVTIPDPQSPQKRDPRGFWEETFGKFRNAGEEAEKGREAEKEREKEREKGRGRESEREEEEKRNPPKKIEGLGEEAFWTTSHVGGALYVLKNNAILRISIGGIDPEDVKLSKARTLAEKALGRL